MKLNVVKGNLLIDKYGNLLKVIDVSWSAVHKETFYEVKYIIKLQENIRFFTSHDIERGDVKKATTTEVKQKLKVQRILYEKNYRFS